MVISGNKATAKHGNQMAQGEFTIDPAKKPKWIDSHVGTKEKKELTTKGIYEIDGDSLKVCYTVGDGKRPTKFSMNPVDEEHPLILVVYKRVK